MTGGAESPAAGITSTGSVAQYQLRRHAQAKRGVPNVPKRSTLDPALVTTMSSSRKHQARPQHLRHGTSQRR
ncbi:MAG: hypothetical protein Q9199_000378 [Rusavskia elegans]